MAFDPHTLGGRCRTFRHLRGFTMQELADSTDVNVSTIQRIETNIVQPSIPTLLNIANTLQIDVAVLLGQRTYKPKEDKWKLKQ